MVAFEKFLDLIQAEHWTRTAETTVGMTQQTVAQCAYSGDWNELNTKQIGTGVYIGFNGFYRFRSNNIANPQ